VPRSAATSAIASQTTREIPAGVCPAVGLCERRDSSPRSVLRFPARDAALTANPFSPCEREIGPTTDGSLARVTLGPTSVADPALTPEEARLCRFRRAARSTATVVCSDLGISGVLPNGRSISDEFALRGRRSRAGSCPFGSDGPGRDRTCGLGIKTGSRRVRVPWGQLAPRHRYAKSRLLRSDRVAGRC
jgi:hypothetical protein